MVKGRGVGRDPLGNLGWGRGVSGGPEKALYALARERGPGP